MKRKIYAMAMLWPILYLFMCSVTQAQGNSASGVAAPAALGKDTIVPLQIGDTIPEVLWHLPLSVINHPEGKNTITLNDYRGRLILLDFWGIGCGSCILALPTLDLIQRQFPDKIAVLPTAQRTPDALRAFWQKNNYTKALQLPSIADESYLHQYFPHRVISHVAWISPGGKLYSTTHTPAINASYLNHALAGKPPYWVPKIDGQQPVEVQQFLQPVAQVDQSNLRNQSPFYSTLLGYQPNIDQQQTLVADSMQGISRYSAVNFSLYQLIQSALAVTPMDIPPSHVFWHTHNSDRYRKPAAEADTEAWRRANYYSYENTMPITTSLADFRFQLQQDLTRFFPGLQFKLDTQRVACFNLIKIADLGNIQSKGKNQYLVGREQQIKAVHNRRLSTLVHLLNEHFVGAPVFDETGHTERVDIDLPVVDLSDVTSVKEALRDYGLDLQEAQRTVVTLTITDQPYTFATY